MDDVISLWNYGKPELRDFLDHLNTYDRNLQFTLEVEIENKLPFSDVLIIRIADKLNFTIYQGQHKTIDIFTLIQITPPPTS